jgi:hypothetical protein
MLQLTANERNCKVTITQEIKHIACSTQGHGCKFRPKQRRELLALTGRVTVLIFVYGLSRLHGRVLLFMFFRAA